MTHALAVAAVEKIQRGGRWAATLTTEAEILDMADMLVAMVEKIRELEQRLGEGNEQE